MGGPPVVVVGIGGAGCRMLSALDRFIQAEDAGDDYLLIAIDANRRDLRNLPPESARRYRLDIDRQSTTDASDIAYLDRQPDFVPTAGTARYRPFGRYLVDSATDKTRLVTFFEETLESFLSDSRSAGKKPLIAWVLNSLGGGTGSGAFPLIMLLLQEACQNIDRPVEYHGIGSLPRLDELDQGIEAPSGEPIHYANAYTALAELQTLLAPSDHTDRPVEIDIDASPADIRTQTIPLTESLFTSYWLLGAPENDQIETERFNRLNRLAACLIHFVRESAERDWLTQEQLYSVTGAELALPLENLADYADVNQAVSNLDEELATLREQQTKLETAATDLQAVIEFDTETAGRVLEHSTPVDLLDTLLPYNKAFLQDCHAAVAELELPAGATQTVESWVDKIGQEIGTAHEPHFVDRLPLTVIAKQIITVLSLARVRDRLDEHQMPQTLEQLYEQWCMGASEAGETADTKDESDVTVSGPVEQWYDDVVACLNDRVADIERQAESSSIPAPFSTAEQRLTALEEATTRAENLVQEYTQLQRFEAGLEDAQSQLRARLRDAQQNLRQQAAAKQDEWETRQRTWTQTSRQQSRLAEALTEERWYDGRLRLPIAETYLENEILKKGQYSNISMTDAVEQGVLELQQLVTTLRTAVETLGEPIEDLAGTESRFAMTNGRLGALAPHQDIDQIKSILTGNTVADTESLTRELDYHFHRYDQVVPWKRMGSLYVLGMYTPVSLGSTSEFQVINEYFTDSESCVSSLFGSLSDTDISQRFAYPELHTLGAND